MKKLPTYSSKFIGYLYIKFLVLYISFDPKHICCVLDLKYLHLFNIFKCLHWILTSFCVTTCRFTASNIWKICCLPFVNFYLLTFLGIIHILRHHMDWVGGLRKWPFVLTNSVLYLCWHSGWVQNMWRHTIWMVPYLPTYIPHMHKQEQSHDAYSHIVQNLRTMFKKCGILQAAPSCKAGKI